MGDPTPDAVRERFEWDAQNFDSIYRLERSLFWRWFNTTFRKAVFQRYDITFAEAGDVRGKKILDIGCGSGVYAVDFARRGARWVLGVDFAHNMLQLATAEAARAGVANECAFAQADFLTLHLNGTFDVSIAMGVFDYQPDPSAFLRKMAAVTTGKVIASFPGHSPIRKRLRQLRYKLTSRGGVHFYSEADVRRLAGEAGFREFHLVPLHSSGTGFVLVGSNA